MKGLVVLQRRFTPIANAIASELRASFDVKEFCGYVITRRAMNFVESQKEINYTDLLLYDDFYNQYKQEKIDITYLKKLEKEYGTPNLWPYLTLDRTIMMDIPAKEYSISPTPKYSHEDMQRILQVYFRNTINFLEKERPDFILGINVAFTGTMVLFHAAKKMGIKYYTLEVGKVGNRVTFTDDYKTLSGVEEIFKKIKNGYKSPSRGEAEEFLMKFRDNPVPPSFAVEAPQTNRINKILALPKKVYDISGFAIRSFYNYLRNPHKEDPTLENPARVFYNKFARRIRNLRNLKKYYDDVDYTEDFAYFPLHFEPEITTLLYAPFYTDQLNLIRQIAKSLPVHFKLYVKEHPAMLEYRPTAYYKELKKIPNVKLIDPKQSSFDLIKNCRLVTTITGTAGFEAALLRKPVITFGDVFYNMLSFVKRNGAIEDLPLLIRSQLENFTHNETELINFLSAIFEDTVPSDVMSIWSSGSHAEASGIGNIPGFRDLVANLAEKIKNK